MTLTEQLIIFYALGWGIGILLGFAAIAVAALREKFFPPKPGKGGMMMLMVPPKDKRGQSK